MLSTRERQFLRGELDDRPKEYLANIRSSLKRKLTEFKARDAGLILNNPRLPEKLQDLSPTEPEQ